VTFFWVLSDFISGRTSSFSLSPDLIRGSDEKKLLEMASGQGLETFAVSDAALWMLLLLRLTAVTTDERLELRNSKIASLLRVELSLTASKKVPFKPCSESSMPTGTS